MFFTPSDIIFIFPLSLKTFSSVNYVKCKVDIYTLYTISLRHTFAFSEIMNIISLSANRNFRLL